MEKQMKPNAIYARYSSHRQDDGTSIEVQLDACRAVAGNNPLLFIDRAKTGKALSRPEFDKMLAAAERGEFSTLYVYKYDRFGRNAHTHAVISDLEDAGIRVVSVTEGDNQLARGVSLVMAQQSSSQLSERVTASLNKRFEQRTWTGGPPPFGYKIITGDDKRQRLAINEQEAGTIRRVFQMYLGESLGFKEIARRLAALGLPTRHGAPWSFTTVRGILINSTLIGEVRFGKRHMKLVRDSHKRIAKMVDPADHRVYTEESLRIISNADWGRVQSKLASRLKARGVRSAARGIRPFTGLLYCAECNSIFYAQKDGRSQRHYYVCSKRQRQGVACCPDSFQVREDLLLADIMEKFAGVFADTEGIIEATVREAEQVVESNREEAGRVKQQISAIEKEIGSFCRVLTDPELSKVVKGAVSRQIGEAEEKLGQLRLALDGLRERAERGAARLASEARLALLEARESFGRVSSGAELHRFMEDFIGPMLVGTDGGISRRAETPPGDVGGVLSGYVAATGHDTVQGVLREAFWRAVAA